MKQTKPKREIKSVRFNCRITKAEARVLSKVDRNRSKAFRKLIAERRSK